MINFQFLWQVSQKDVGHQACEGDSHTVVLDNDGVTGQGKGTAGLQGKEDHPAIGRPPFGGCGPLVLRGHLPHHLALNKRSVVLIVVIESCW